MDKDILEAVSKAFKGIFDVTDFRDDRTGKLIEDENEISDALDQYAEIIAEAIQPVIEKDYAQIWEEGFNNGCASEWGGANSNPYEN